LAQKLKKTLEELGERFVCRNWRKIYWHWSKKETLLVDMDWPRRHNDVVEASIGGMKLTTTIEGDSVLWNARYAQEYNSIEALKNYRFVDLLIPIRNCS
jgi:hypothetical protein